jgi:hypothetical protein
MIITEHISLYTNIYINIYNKTCISKDKKYMHAYICTFYETHDHDLV